MTPADLPLGAVAGAAAPRPRTVLLCHHDAPIHFDGIARWLAAWSELGGVVRIAEPGRRLVQRLKRERDRIGSLRLLDVLAFRITHRLTGARQDREWLEQRLAELQRRYPEPVGVPTVGVTSPNTPEAEEFISQARPDLVIALCKNILAARIFSIPTHGTFVFHPGICPEYRNAHGCFWALAENDLSRVGMTVLRVDRGIDTGPVFGYFSARYDERRESHIIIQHRMTLDNLDGIADLLLRVHAGAAKPIDTSGRTSGEWGQPWLTRYLRWKWHARKRQGSHDSP